VIREMLEGEVIVLRYVLLSCSCCHFLLVISF